MTDCSLIRDLLPFYKDNAVSAESESIIREHLENCPECKKYYDHIRRIPHSLQEPDNRGVYRYSDVARELRRNAMIEYAIGAALLMTSAAGIAKIILDGRKRD